MIKRIVNFALNQPLFMILMVVLFIGGGLFAFKSLPIEAFPDVSDIQVAVITLFPGHAPEEVEKQVTIPLEISLSGLPHSVRMFSHTQFGLSFIMLTFDDKVNDYFARQQVAERFASADLPEGVAPQLAPLSTAIGELFRYRLKGDGYSTRDLRTLQDWVVERQLRMAQGVADVVTFGGMIKHYEVNPDLAQMKFQGISLQQLFTALGRGNANAGGSYSEHGQQQYLIRGLGLLRSSDDISNIVVAERNGTPILVRDIAAVTTSGVPRQGIVGQDEADDIVSGIVLMRKGENPSEVLAEIKERVKMLNTSILPKGVQIVPFYDRTQLIDTTLKTVFKNLLEGATLVSIVLFLFLGNVRAAFIVAILIPLSLLATFLGLSWKGIPANLLSLGAMDFGIIVDGAVIVVENVFRKLSEHHGERTKDALRHAISEATIEVGRPTFFSMLIIIAAHIPIFTLQRHEGRIFAPMAYTVTSALIGSLIFSLTLVPLLCFFLLRKNLPEKENALVHFCKRLYQPALQKALTHPRWVVGLAVIGLAASLAIVPRLGTEFLPELNEGTIWINLNLPPSISVTEATAQCARIRAALRAIPEVKTVISKAGRPEDGTDPKLINMAEVFVDLKPAKEWRPHLTKEDVIEQMDHALSSLLPGMDPSFSQPIRDNVLESISQIDGQIVVKVFGEDSKKLHEYAAEVMKTISPIRGVARAFIDRGGELPQELIQIDRERAARYGLNISDIQDLIEVGLGGKTATEIWEGEKHFGVVVRLSNAERALPNLHNLLVDTPDGRHIPLSDVAEFKETSGSMNISRENGLRVAAIAVFIHGRDMGSLVKEMQEKVKQNVHLTEGYYLNFGGEFENQERAMRRLMLIVPISVFMIFVLLFDAFKSIKSAMLILLNVPFALIGGIVALLVTGIPLSVSAAIGFIALFGQAVLNGVVMVSYFNQLRDKGLSAWHAVIVGAPMRLRTVLMTALLAMFGLLPMALSHGIGSETQKPLAIVIIGGLISATVLTLIVLPTLYLLFERKRSTTGPAAEEEASGMAPNRLAVA
jgi:cobalt-zinc-cadmium resistance protein CzcA